ncbi:MAG TPA: hypothetical protein GX507_09590 [Clostridia bacterium]|nr:hypothetical protein [Clostridia bacterium]
MNVLHSPKWWLRTRIPNSTLALIGLGWGLFLASALFAFGSIRHGNKNVNIGVLPGAYFVVPDADISGMGIPPEDDPGKHHMVMDVPDGTNASDLSPEELSERKGLWVEVSVSEQLLRVWDGVRLVKEMECPTGPESNPTPVGEFVVRERDHWFSPGGLVNLSASDSTWFYRHVPDGTAVVIHN